MDVLERVEQKAKLAAKILKFEITYYPGITEDLDTYKATHEELNINCYGPTEQQALESAQAEACAQMMDTPQMAEEILRKK